MSFVYIAPLKNKTAFKVGKSNSPAERIMSLTRFYDFEFEDISVIDCKSQDGAYRLEGLLHSVCETQRVVFEYDGGTEFFAYGIYGKLLSVVTIVAEMNGYIVTKMPSVESIVILKDVKHDDIDCMLNAIANKVKNKRLGYNISQVQLATICGLSRRTIQNMEDDAIVTLPHFIRILKALDLDHVLSELEVDVPMRQRAR